MQGIPVAALGRRRALVRIQVGALLASMSRMGTPVGSLRYGILGPLEVCDQGDPLPLGGAKQRAVLAVLILHRGEVVPTERMVDELWSDRPPATAAKTVQVYVSQLRKALGDGHLVTHGHG
jgi:DNA-binding SARP family transcriptional activator